jgi:hypothetical protein
MNPGNLSLQQAPPLSVPGRFFITAPVFGAAAALIVLFSGHDLLLSRWTPGMLAVTHCLVLGFFASIMIGAIQQMLPVLAGAIILRPRLVATVVYVQWVPAIVLLVTALMRPASGLFIAALALISGAILTFLIAVVQSLRKAGSQSESVPGIKLAVSSLFVTLLLGIGLGLGYTGAMPLWRPALTNLHMAWGFVGWIGILIMAVAWQVVPMFQITPPYPVWLRRATVPSVLVLLLAKTALAGLSGKEIAAGIETAVDLMIAVGLACFAWTTLKIQSAARRRVRDSHRGFWRLAMVNLLAVCVLWMAAEATGDPLFDMLAAAVFLLGFAMAVVTGMLIKIVSFLIWLHLQAANDGLIMSGQPGFTVPTMQAVIASRQGNWLLYLLIAAELAIIGALLSPEFFAAPAAALWLGQFSLLAGVIGNALYQYRRTARNVRVRTQAMTPSKQR